MGADLKQIKLRMKTVDSMMHVTAAMKLMSSSMIKKAEDNYKKYQQYYNVVSDIFKQLDFYRINYNQIKKSDLARDVIFIIESDRGLAGGFNVAVEREFHAIDNHHNAVIIPIGKKACSFVESNGLKSDMYIESSEKPDLKLLSEFISRITQDIKDGKVSNVFLVTTKYRNPLIHNPSVINLFGDESDLAKEDLFDFDIEPGFNDLYFGFLNQYLLTSLKSFIYESYLSEQHARHNAMQTATENAEEMLEDLNLSYNRARQNTITQEITEIVAGAQL